jgi:hypothetical protein
MIDDDFVEMTRREFDALMTLGPVIRPDTITGPPAWKTNLFGEWAFVERVDGGLSVKWIKIVEPKQFR